MLERSPTLRRQKKRNGLLQLRFQFGKYATWILHHVALFAKSTFCTMSFSKSEVEDTIEKSDHVLPTESKTPQLPRGVAVEEDVTTGQAAGYDHARMKGRELLSYEEEKKLLRRVDWRLMPLCALIFMVKNIDANNVSCRTASPLQEQ